MDDDYTFEEAGSPHVQGATVSLLNPYDNTQVVETGVTDATGAVTFTNVPAGPYDLQVQATGHSSYENSYTVVPGITNNDEVFIAAPVRDATPGTWCRRRSRTPTRSSSRPTFRPNVPAPVVTITAPPSIPTLQPGQSGTFNVTITNHGLIAAQDVTLDLPTDPEYTFTALSTDIGVVARREFRDRSHHGDAGGSPGRVNQRRRHDADDESRGAQPDRASRQLHAVRGLFQYRAPRPCRAAAGADGDAERQRGGLADSESRASDFRVTTLGGTRRVSQSVEILASGATPGILEPGESERVPVYYVGLACIPVGPSATRVSVFLSAIARDNTTPPIGRRSRLFPASGTSAAAWSADLADLRVAARHHAGALRPVTRQRRGLPRGHRRADQPT